MDDITEHGLQQLLYCIKTHLKKLESLDLLLRERENSQAFSAQFVRYVTRYASICLINLKQYTLNLQGPWKIIEVMPEKDLPRLIAFNKSKFSTSRIESREACRCRQETTVSVAATN